ncbi:hypothetical protein O206_23565 [Ochrobactrum sp. EGD-AQ16]|nr:hypothetical protein O206_23565 [Ochrobactrum sp. EGD-AQ16]
MLRPRWLDSIDKDGAFGRQRHVTANGYLPRFQKAMKQLAQYVAVFKTDARAVRHTDASICHNSVVRKPTKRLKTAEVHLRASKA